jgi:hypothetical protein
VDSTDYGTSSTCESPLFLGEKNLINAKKSKYFWHRFPVVWKKIRQISGKKMILTHFNSDFSSVASFKQVFRDYLTLRSVSSINNPQNSEMKICGNMKLTC